MKTVGLMMSICGVILLLFNAYIYLFSHSTEKYTYLVIIGILLAGFGSRIIRKHRKQV